MTQRKKKSTGTEPRFLPLLTIVWTTIVVGPLAAAVSAVIILAIDRPHRTPVGEWISDFSKSPGLAGLCAIIAAALAFWGIHRQVSVSRRGLAHQREVETNRAWWERFEWAATRAVPTSRDDIPLPYDVILNTLTALVNTATDDVQRATIKAVVDEAGARHSKEHPNGDDSHKDEDFSPIDDRMTQALQNYARSAGSTSARSAIVDAQLYDYQSIEALTRLLSPENVQQQPRLPREREVGGTRRTGELQPDAIVTHRGKRIIVEMKNSRNKGGIDSERARETVAQIRSLIEAAGADAGLIVTPGEFRSGVLDRGEDNILAVTWGSPEDDNALKDALDRLADDL